MGINRTAARALIALALMHVQSALAITVIDDFSVGPIVAVLNSSTPNIGQNQEGLSEAHAIGVRRVGTSLNFPVDPSWSVDVTLGSGEYHISGAGNLEGHSIRWGLQTTSSGPMSWAMNKNLSADGSTGFRINLIAIKNSFLVFPFMSVRSGVNEGVLKSGQASFTLPVTTTGYSLLVPFSAFSGSVDFTDIDHIAFGLGGNYPGPLMTVGPITTARPGDLDGDGDVDGADFVAWQTHFPLASGATLADGDADGDGDVDGADFVVWQTNFPFTPAPAASPLPEPQTLLLALAALASYVALSRRPWGNGFLLCFG